MSTIIGEKGRSIGLDCARAFAIILVITSHFSRNSKYLGFWGVEIFFSLSGFLIGQILWRNYSIESNWDLNKIFNFWSRRWWRTLPNYYLFFFINLLLNYFLLKPIPQFHNLLNYAVFGQNFVSRSIGFFEVSWSLCVEEWLYLSFPIILFFASKIIKSRSVSFIFTILILVMACAAFRYFASNSIRSNDLRVITLARLDAIAYGILSAYFFTVIKVGDVKKKVLFFIGCVLLLSPIVIKLMCKWDLDKIINNQIVLVLVPLGAALMLPTINSSSNYKSNFITRSITKVSLWSYSLYLCHMPILYILYKIIGENYKVFFINLSAKIIGLGFAIFISSVLFKYFEAPLTAKRPKEIK
ncbi:acyltransferase family protein [Mucilaginibacter polytrichastri]|uniref:Acyltransferase 3 domain-containing protein n=1 Tax=Mucilaginibacter polytrichastri TaxID=1302689 RepID=A0A1Q5ZTR0_9SPHI|nr:acyltransferase [Mucilaginibacter polytrichastri]OKS85146.1 hypothetical protein RG47T_0590 [Mucilaginibacter polytrichastri]SFS43786.1 Peptidoglycan/LPS O-acetylase OafA/YrhL, contains acyltransferase and SGNH-hydrolase domains [Mucilaginibacter polytrichastri]